MLGRVYPENIFSCCRSWLNKSNFTSKRYFYSLNSSGGGGGIGRINFIIIFGINDFHKSLLLLPWCGRFNLKTQLTAKHQEYFLLRTTLLNLRRKASEPPARHPRLWAHRKHIQRQNQ